MANILLVDDEVDLLNVGKLLLSTYGHSVVSTDNAVHAIEIAQRAKVDVVITDWMMPVADGLELCRRLRAEKTTAGIPIILSSAFDSVPDRAEAPYDRFIAKPWDIVKLLRAVDQLVRQARG